eukprot:1269558-Pyramimonas_sp.AAC.1
MHGIAPEGADNACTKVAQDGAQSLQAVGCSSRCSAMPPECAGVARDPAHGTSKRHRRPMGNARGYNCASQATWMGGNSAVAAHALYECNDGN